ETAWCELVHNVGTNQVVRSRGIERTRLIQHRLRNICAGYIQSEVPKESSRSTGSTAKVERARAMVMTLNQPRQIAKREIIRSMEPKRGVRARAFLFLVHIAEGLIHGNFLLWPKGKGGAIR